MHKTAKFHSWLWKDIHEWHIPTEVWK